MKYTNLVLAYIFAILSFAAIYRGSYFSGFIWLCALVFFAYQEDDEPGAA